MRDNTEKGQRQMSIDPLLIKDRSTNEAKPQKGIMSLIRSHTMKGHVSKEKMPLLAGTVSGLVLHGKAAY